MKYVMAFGTGDRSSRHPVADGSTRETLAEDCRNAALSFMTGVGEGWDKLDLALWLTGDYARATHEGWGARTSHGWGVREKIELRGLIKYLQGRLAA